MILDRFRLDDKVAIVTGAGRGIGAGCALAFAEVGAHVACAARTREQIEATAEKVRGLGYREEIADHYDLRLSLAEDPAVFPASVIPRLENIPEGVLNPRWDIDLTGQDVADQVTLTSLLAVVSGVGTRSERK